MVCQTNLENFDLKVTKKNPFKTKKKDCRLLPNKIENTIIQEENYIDIFPTYVVDELIFVNSIINRTISLPRRAGYCDGVLQNSAS